MKNGTRETQTFAKDWTRGGSGSFSKFKKIHKNSLKNTANYSLHSSLRPRSAQHFWDCFGNGEPMAFHGFWGMLGMLSSAGTFWTHEQSKSHSDQNHRQIRRKLPIQLFGLLKEFHATDGDSKENSNPPRCSAELQPHINCQGSSSNSTKTFMELQLGIPSSFRYFSLSSLISESGYWLKFQFPSRIWCSSWTWSFSRLEGGFEWTLWEAGAVGPSHPPHHCCTGIDLMDNSPRGFTSGTPKSAQHTNY